MLWWIIAAVAVVALFVFGGGRPKDVKGKVILITGGASGIGLGMARKFAALGARIVIWDINPKALSDVETEFKASNYDISTYVCDVSKRETVYQVADQVRADVGKVDILINNAGIVIGKSFMETTDDQSEKVFRVNTLAVMWITKAFLPDMLKTSGHLVTIASAAGFTGMPLLVDYCASKFAAVGFMESLRHEHLHLGIDNIKFTTIMPFYINTGMFDGVKSSFPFPILSVEYAVNSIVNGVLTNTVEVYVPPTLRVRYFMHLLPLSLSDYVNQKLGLSRAMDHFKGRGTK